MKIFKYLLIIVGILFLIIVVSKSMRNADSTSITVLPLGTKEDCYIWNTEAGDSATLRMRYTIDKPEVSGVFDWSPAEKDRKTGPFTGTLAGDGEDGIGFYTVWWKSSGEGTTSLEELRIVTSIADGQAAVAFGEMKGRGDGVYIYANPDQLSYEPALTLTECSDPAVYQLP